MMKRMLIAMLAVASIAAMPLMADEWYDSSTGYTWTYRINGDTVEISACYRITFSGYWYDGQWIDPMTSAYVGPAISPEPSGSVTIPSTLGGYPVMSIGDSAFLNCSGLTSVTIPAGVTSIGYRAFYGCSGLRSVTIPDGVTSIGNSAFSSCNDLTSVAIPNSVTRIGDSAFYGCSGLTNVTIPGGVTRIGNSAFYGCSGLMSVTISDGVRSIGDSAFKGCSGLTSVTIPDSVTSIGDGAFGGCSGLADPNGFIIIRNVLVGYTGVGGRVTIPAGVTSIGGAAFQECSGLTSITIPDGVTRIGKSAFSRCSGLMSVAIPDSVTSIGNFAFQACSGLTSITIPDGVRRIGDSAFYGCSGLRSVTIPDSVTSIGDGAFANCSGLTSMMIPDGVTSIGYSAFHSCSGLTNVTIPDSVTSIGDGAFGGCSGLADPNGFIIIRNVLVGYAGVGGNVTIPDGVTSIGYRAFEGYNSWLRSVTIPDSVTSIGDWAFADCSGLTSMMIPDGVTSIGYRAFYGCSGLTSMTIPDGVTSIGDSAFYGCRGLTSVTIPDSVTSIGYLAFEYCSGLTNVTIGSGVTSIGARAFSRCSQLLYDKTSIPGVILVDGWAICNDGTVTGALDLTGIRGIGGAAFSGCNRLTSVVLPSRMTRIKGSTFSSCSGLTSITIPDGVTSIGDSAFYGCSGLTSITIPDGVTSIGDSAFYGCSGLTSITIPDGVTSIGYSAFENCSGLTNVTIGAGVVSIGGDDWSGTPAAFSGCSQLLYDKTSIPGILLVDGWAVGNDGTLTGELDLTGIRGIAGAAFFECSGLTNVTIPEGVTGIGEMAFAECGGLTRVTIPASVTRIEGAAFANCGGLTNLTFLGNAPYIDDDSLYAYVFDDVGEDCTVYVRHDSTGWGVEIPGTWNGMHIEYLQDATTHLVTVVADQDLGENGGFAALSINGSMDVVTVGLGDSIEVPDHAVVEIMDVVIDGGAVMWDGGYTVSGSSLSDVTADVTVTIEVGERRWINEFVSSFTVDSAMLGMNTDEVVFSGEFESEFSHDQGWNANETIMFMELGIIVYGANSENGEFVVLDSNSQSDLTISEISGVGENGWTATIDRQGYTHFEVELIARPFAGFIRADGILSVSPQNQPTFTIDANGVLTEVDLNGATEVTIPNRVTSIGDYAFYGCTGLKSVTIPNSVTSIGCCAFSDCSGLTSLTIGEGVTEIGEGAFYNCSGLTNVTIPINVKSIGDEAFRGCGGLAEDGFVIIRDILYDYVGTASDVTIPDGVTSISSSAFELYGGLMSVTIPNSVTNIGDHAFDGCFGLTGTLTIPNSVTSIGSRAFLSCSGLTSVTIGEGVTEIGERAFGYCSDLTNVTMSINVTSIGVRAFEGCGGLAEDGLIIIRDILCSYEGSASDVTIPDGVTSISSFAFSGCSGLTSVTIPASVTSIGSRAFSWCEGLTSVIFLGNAPEIGDNAFDEVDSECMAYVCRGSTGWGVEIPGTWQGMRIDYLSDDTQVPAPTPVAVWDGDFTTLTRGAFTLSANGNTKTDSYLQISDNYGITVTSADVQNDFTVIMRCSGLNLNADNAQVLFTSYAIKAGNGYSESDVRLSDLTGVNLPANNAVCRGIWEGGDWNNNDATQGLVPANYTTLIYNHQLMSGTYAYALGPISSEDDTVPLSTLYGSYNLRSKWQNYKGFAIGGLRGTTSEGLLPATGLKITSIAVFSDTLTEAEMKQYRFPSECQTINVLSDTTVSAINAQANSASKHSKVMVSGGVTILVDAAFSAKIPSVSSTGSITLSADAQPSASWLAHVDFSGVQGGLLRTWLTPGVVGFNFCNLIGSDTSGALVEGTWYFDASSANGASTALFADGLSTLTWTSAILYSCSGNTIISGYLDDGAKNGYGAEVHLSNVPYETYDVIVYCSSDTTGQFLAKTVNGTTYTWDSAVGVAVEGSAAWGKTALSVPAYGVNALRIKNLSGPLTIYGGIRNGNVRGGIAAFQIMPPDTPDVSHAYTSNNITYAYNGIDNGNAAQITAVLSDVIGDVRLPNSIGGQTVTSVGDHAFRSCIGLTSVTIPNSVTSIGNYAFYKCEGLTNVIFEGNAPAIGEYCFVDVNPSCVVYVKSGSTGWGVEIPGTWQGMRIEYLDEEPLPDLVVSIDAITPQSALMPGDTVTVRYVERNVGETNVVATWTDRLMLVNEVGTQKPLKTWSMPISLDAGQSVTETIQAVIPDLVPLAGQVRVVVAADVNGDVEESNEANNEGVSEWMTLGKKLYLTSASDSVKENVSGGVRFTVRRSGPVDEATTVMVGNSDATSASHPTSVTIPAGSVSTMFTVAPIDNAIVDGTRVVSVSVAADGFKGTVVSLTILDDEVPRLTVTLDKASIREGDGVITATVTREGATDEPLTVYLSGTSGSRVSYPSSVVIPAGAASATFEISVPNNDTAQVASELTLRASSSGYQSTAVTYTVEDDDVPGVVLTIAPAEVQEGGVVRAALMRADTSDQSKAITVRLTASDPNEIGSMPSSVTIPVRTAGREFYIYIADDGDDNDNREITIDGSVLIESCGCNGQPSSGDAITATLGIIDNDGPALSLRADPATMREGLNPAGYLILSHNSTLTEDLTVHLWVDAENEDEISISETVTIHAGETSVRIPVVTLDDGVEDGSQLVSVYVEDAAGVFAPASTWVLVTDQNMPDLYAVDVIPQYVTATAGESLSISFSITNTGYMAVSDGVAYSIYCVKGADSSVGEAGLLVCSGVAEGDIGIGGALSISRSVTIPNVVGDCRFAVVVDPDDAIVELDNANNTTYSSVFSVSPLYIAEAQVEGTTFLQGTEIEITGLATIAGGATPAASVEVEVYLMKNGIRWRTLTATTDAQGRFAVTFKPTSSEAGHYVVGASFPGMESTAEQDSFDILGMKRTSSEYMEWYVTVGEEKTLSTSIANMSPVPLTGLNVEIVGAPQECEVKATFAETIAGNALANLSVSIRATGVSGGGKYKTFVVRITSQDGVVLEVPLYFYAKSATAKLTMTPSTLETTMTVGSRQIIEFSVGNIGSANTGRVTVQIPQLSWMRIVSGGESSGLGNQEYMTVQLELSPDASLALNYTYTPTIAVNCENGDGIVIPCKFTPVAGTSGRIRLLVMEKYSLTAGYTMPISNATIQVKNKYTGEVVASGTSCMDGTWESGDIPGGAWKVYVTVPYHAAYEDEVTVMAERTVEKTVMMDTEAVSAYWREFRRVDVEDETDIDLVCEYVTTVPQPVVVIKECPDELPQLEEGQSTAFNVVAVNEGWIAAQDVSLDLPDLDGYEWTAQQDIGLVPAGASVTVPVVLTRKRTEPVRRGLRAASSTKVICKLVIRIGYFWDCGWDRKWAAFPKLMVFKGCFYQTDAEKIPQPPRPRPIGPEIPGDPKETKGPTPGGIPPEEVVLGDTCNPCVMGRGYALIDSVLDYFTGVTLFKMTDDDIRNLKEMGLTDDSELANVLSFFGMGKNLDTSKPMKEQAVDALKSMLKESTVINALKNWASEIGDVQDEWDPRYADTIGKIGVVAGVVSTISDLADVIGGINKVLSPDACAHLNLTPLIDSDGNINEALAALQEKPIEITWEEPVRTIGTGIGLKKSSASDGASMMNPNIPQSLWSGLLKMETYRIQLVAYKDILRGFFPENSTFDDPTFGQIAECFGVLQRHIETAGITAVELSEFDGDAASTLSSEQKSAFAANWNNMVTAYVEADGHSQTTEVSIDYILRNYRIMAQTENIARSLGYLSVGHMVTVEKPYLLAAIDKESGSVCASVKLKISQTVRMTREAFEGVLEIGNSSASASTRDILLVPVITDDMGTDVTKRLFAFSQVGSENMSGESILKGGMTLGASQTGTATIRFVPSVDAAPVTPKTYRFGGLLTYINPFTGVAETKEIIPIAMTVNPSPCLTFDYFVQRDVLGDDPFTRDVVEPSIPAEVSLVIRNSGYGDASNVTMRTIAPQILENTKGLMVDFSLANECMALNGESANIGLNDVRLGTIPARGQTIAQWWLTCSIQGHFKNFDASFTHRSSFGETEANMSLVDAVNVHSLIRSIDADGDALPDFLTCEHTSYGTPDTVFCGNGNEEPVLSAGNATCGVLDGTFKMSLTVSPRMAGWNYASCLDGGNGRFEIVKVVRENGTELPLRNVWLTDRTFEGEGDPIIENRIHLVDNFAGLGSTVYTVHLTPVESNPLQVESLGGVEDGSVVAEMPDSISVTFTKAISPMTFDRTDITMRRQGVKIDDISAISIAPQNESGMAFSIGGLRDVSTTDGTYTLTVQAAFIADEDGVSGISGKSIMWTVMGGVVSAPVVSDLRISPDYGYSELDGITYGTDFTLTGNVDRDGLLAQVLARRLGSSDMELWSATLSGREIMAPIRLTGGGNVTLVVVLTDSTGNSSEAELPLFIDTVPLTGELRRVLGDAAAWGQAALPDIEDVVTTAATLMFSDRVMEEDVTLEKFSLTRNGEAVALNGVTLRRVEDNASYQNGGQGLTALPNSVAYVLEGLDALCAEDGQYVLRFDGSAVRKYSSGLTMAGSLVMRWRYKNPDREPPTVTEVLFDGETPHEVYTNVFSSVSVTFSEAVNVPELIANGLIGRAARIDLLDAAGSVTGCVEAARSASAPYQWNAEANTLAWQIDPFVVPAGRARLMLDAGLIKDLAGNRLAVEVNGQDARSPSGLRTYSLSETVLAQVNAQAMSMWYNGELYVGEKTADNKGKIRHYAANGTWSYLQAEGVDIEIPAQGCQGASVAFADMDGDGVAETYVGTAGGDILKYPGGATIVSLGANRAMPYAYDMDGDGCDELVAGGMDGRIRVISRDPATGTYNMTILTDVNGAALSVPNGRAAPVVADINHDGLADIVSGDTAGNVWAYLGEGTAWCAAPIIVFTNNVSLADRSRLGYGDVNGDGIEDLIVGRSDGSVTAMLGAETPSPIVPFAVKAVVSASAGTHGVIAPMGDTTYDGGDTPEYTITPEVGYQVADVLVDGVSIGATNNYVFAPLTTSHIIHADFATVPYAITYTGLKGAANTNPETYTVEDAITFAAPGDVYGWVFKGWTPASIALGSTGAIEVTANWERQKFDVTVNGETRQYDYEDVAVFATNAVINCGATQYVCRGWAATNAEPVAGDGARAEFRVLGNVALGWLWETNVVTLAQSVNAEGFAWTTGGAARWMPEWADEAADGLHQARCGTVPNGTNAWLATTLEGPGTLSFKWRSALASRNTKYQFVVDGEVKGMLTGTNDWTEVSFTVFGDRTHEVKWRLMTGRSGSSAGDWVALDCVVWTPTVPPTLAEALNTNLVWTTEGDVLWRGVARESLTDGRDAWAVVSGLGDDGTSAVQTRVYGSGILLFDWAISCEEDYDWMELTVDGEVRDYISGKYGWTQSAVEIVGDGWHVVRWEFIKDEMDDPELVGENVARLDNVVWNSDDPAPVFTETQTTPVPVPYSELETNFKSYLDAADGDYEVAAHTVGRNGYAIWESYLAGLEPDNQDSKFIAKIEMVDDKPVVTWEPDTPELRATRTYRILAKKTLSDANWTDVTDKDQTEYRFFIVTVNLP